MTRSSQRLSGADSYSDISSLTNPQFISIPASSNVELAIQRVRTIAHRGDIFYLYVVDASERLLGVVSIRNLLVARDTDSISSLISKNVVFLSERMPLKDVYRMFSESRFLSLPVVDVDGKIKGVLHAHELAGESENAAETLFEERSRGQLFELLGIKGEEEGLSPLKIARGRIPWLLVNIVGGALSAFLIHSFGAKLDEAVLFLAFVPILLIISESVGMQAASVAISTLNRTAGSQFSALFLKELGVASCLGLVCSLAISGVVFLWHRQGNFSLTIGLTVLLSTIGVSSLGSLIPYLIHRFKLDPNVSAGPVILAISDFCTLLLYLGIAFCVSHQTLR